MAQQKLDEITSKALDQLALLGGETLKDDDVLFEPNRTKIALPGAMSLKDAIVALGRKLESDEEPIEFTRTFPYRPWDGAVCMLRSLERHFGMVHHGGGQPVMGFFGPMETPPQLITIPIGPNETASVPWGGFEVPILPECYFYLGEVRGEDGIVFSVIVNAKRKHRFVIEGIFRLVEEELRKSSIYRGRAITGDEMPKFLDVESFDRERVVYASETYRQLEASVLCPIRFADGLRELAVPLKRAVLLHGTYGTGKTLFGMIVAQEAARNGWTFILAKPQHDLMQVMTTAKLYAPAVVFCEDVDAIADPDRANADHVSLLLDAFDGLATKQGHDVMVVLTTNHPDKIHKGMVRPGRLDAVIEIAAPDVDGIARMLALTIGEDRLQATPMELQQAAESMAGFLPAFVVEAGTRATRYALVRAGGRTDDLRITADDLIDAAEGLRPQLALMEDAREHSDRDSIGRAIARELAGSLVIGSFRDNGNSQVQPILLHEERK